jgi:hypothetical protein
MIFNGIYKEIALIGKGGFGYVYKVRCIKDNKMYNYLTYIYLIKDSKYVFFNHLFKKFCFKSNTLQ